MTYNLHPIFVHFPIALLVLYSVVKILPLKTWFPKVSWRHIERALLFFGVLGAFAALATGETAEHLIRPNHQLVEAHSTFAAAATWLYVALLLGELAAFINARMYLNKYQFVSKLSLFVEKVICNPIFSRIVALAALVTLSIAGLLGGVMAFGVTADPMSSIVLQWLGITYP
ncbi:MAG: DUF2231 domain-containing protein [Patescibacteria group bacterium]